MKSCGLIREAVDTQLWSADVLHQLGNGIHELRCPNGHHQHGKEPCEDATKKELMGALSATCVTWLAAVNDSTGNRNMPSERERT